jgi:hypothetical protein
VKKKIKVERGVYNSLTCLHAGKSACQKKHARQLANWQASQLAPTLKPPNISRMKPPFHCARYARERKASTEVAYEGSSKKQVNREGSG